MPIVSYYIDVPVSQQEKLDSLLSSSGLDFFDATDSDPYTSGFNKLDSLKAIKSDIGG